jgi:hypothetical protein
MILKSGFSNSFAIIFFGKLIWGVNKKGSTSYPVKPYYTFNGSNYFI